MKTPENLPQLLFQSIERFGTKRAVMRHKVSGRWKDVTHQELARRVHHTALGLLELGVQPGDHVAILSDSRPEWVIADFACLAIGCADVTIYPTLTASQVSYLIQDSESKVIFLSDQAQLDKIQQVRDTLPTLKHTIMFDDAGESAPALPMSQLDRMGAAAVEKYPNYRRDALAVAPSAIATLIYTSGTTGDPKGVMLTHRNFTSNVLASLRILSVGSDDACLSILPLSHSFERMAGLYTMLYAGVTINFSEGIEAVADNMRECRPTVVVSVPRLYEKIFARVVEAAQSGGPVKKRIFHWARRTGEAWTDLHLDHRTISPFLRLQRGMADRLVFRKLRARTGGRLRFFVSGGAPLAPEIARFFYAAGLPILEGYGLTETSPVVSVNPYEAVRIGTVGPPVPGVEVRFAEDGELLVRGPNVMKGYYGKPDATAEAVDSEGWFHTGDIGEFDDAGYIKITDRKKDIIVTAGGKKIAPQPIENRVKSNQFVANAVILGDKRKYAIILVVPDFDACTVWAAQRNLPAAQTPEELIAIPEVAAKIEREVMLNLRDLARFEMPKKVILLEHDFSEAGGELTPTLKVKRKVVEERYRDQIEAAYREDDV